jgi:hypothetical protein
MRSGLAYMPQVYGSFLSLLASVRKRWRGYIFPALREFCRRESILLQLKRRIWRIVRRRRLKLSLILFLLETDA